MVVTPASIMISNVDDEAAALFKLFCSKNRLPYKMALEMFVSLVTARSWLSFGNDFDLIDSKIKEWLKENDLERYGRMSIIQKTVGFGILPLTKSDILSVRKNLVAQEEEAIE